MCCVGGTVSSALGITSFLLERSRNNSFLRERSGKYFQKDLDKGTTKTERGHQAESEEKEQQDESDPAAYNGRAKGWVARLHSIGDSKSLI